MILCPAHSLWQRRGVSAFSSTASLFPQISLMDLWPLSPSVISVSARSPRSTSSTPWSPAKASPYMTGRPTASGKYAVRAFSSWSFQKKRTSCSPRTACAPIAMALMTSLPVRMPESKRTVKLPSSWALRTLEHAVIFSRAENEAMAPSSCRAPARNEE